MKLRLNPQIRDIVKDSLSIFPQEYFCIFTRDAGLFFKSSGKNKLDCLLRLPGDSTSIQFLEQFFKKLETLKEYYGQPLTILINNTETFSYIKFLKELKSSKVLESVKSLQSGDIKFSQVVRSDTPSPVFAGQGISKVYLSTIESLGQTLSIPVLEIVTLPIYLMLNLPSANLINPGIALFELEKNIFFFLLWDKLGNVVPGEVNISEDKHSATNVLKNLKKEFFDNEADVSSYFYSLAKAVAQPGINSNQLAFLLKSDINKAQNARRSLLKPKTAGIAKATVTALNSARLLISVLTGTCLISLLAAGISILLASDNDEITERYQILYNNVMQLESELDSLNRLNQTVIALQPSQLQAAEILSSFCQKQYNGVRLTQLSISRTPSDSVRVEARGVSRRESSVFTYHQH